MTQPAKPWQEMSAAEKRDAVKAHIVAGTGYSKIADLLGAPNRHCVAGVVSRLREIGALPPPPSKQQTGASGGAIVRAKAKARREKGAALRAGNIANKAESRKNDPELKVKRAFAFDPIEGVEPVPFGSAGCKYPVDGLDGPGLLWCGAPRDGRTYCEAHHALAYLPVPIRTRNRTAERAVERLF